MADTDSLDLQAISDRNQPCGPCDYGVTSAPCVCRDHDPRIDVNRLIFYARSLESQLAEKDATVAHEDRSADEALRRLRALSSSACPGCKGTHYKDIDTVAAEIASLRSQLAESQRENQALRLSLISYQARFGVS